MDPREEDTREQKRRRTMAETARRAAAHFATYVDGDENEDVSSQAPGDAEKKADSREGCQYEWEPDEGRRTHGHQNRMGAKTLKSIALDAIAQCIHDVATLWGIPDSIKVELASRVCDSRNLTPEVCKLFYEGDPREVELTNCTEVDEKTMKMLCKTCATLSLRRLHLGFCGRGMGDVCTRALGASCALGNLVELSLNGAYRLSDAGIECVLKGAGNLEVLGLQHCSNLRGDFLACLPSDVQKLNNLDLSECRGISGDMLKGSLPCLNQLSTLKLDGNQEVGEELLKLIGQNCSLQNLSLKRCRGVTDAALRAACENCEGLIVLSIDDNSNLTENSMACIAEKCKTLKEFSLRHCTKISEDSLCNIAANGRLTHLNIASLDQIKGPLLQTLGNLCHATLESLDISFCRNIPENAVGWMVDACSNLRHMVVYGNSQLSMRFVNGHRNDELVLTGLGTI